jgi:hypothetical protein
MDGDPEVSVAVGSEFVVAAPEVLDECVIPDHD